MCALETGHTATTSEGIRVGVEVVSVLQCSLTCLTARFLFVEVLARWVGIQCLVHERTIT